MIRGKVNRNGQAWVDIEMLDHDGWFRTFEVVLDTGFNGDILLPPGVIQRLEVVESDEIEMTLANGQEIQLGSWRGTVLWHDQPLSVRVVQADGAPLLGMNLLQGSRATLDVEVDGDVKVDELSR